jgi:hypothetical protein
VNPEENYPHPPTRYPYFPGKNASFFKAIGQPRNDRLEGRQATLLVLAKMAPSFEEIGQLPPNRQTDRRQRITTPTVPKPKSGPIDDGKDGSFLRGDRSISTELKQKKWLVRLRRSLSQHQNLPTE